MNDRLKNSKAMWVYFRYEKLLQLVSHIWKTRPHPGIKDCSKNEQDEDEDEDDITLFIVESQDLPHMKKENVKKLLVFFKST